MDKNKAWGLKSGESAGEETRPQPRLRTVDRGQMVLRPTNVEQLIEADHPARAIWEIVGQQDLDGYYGAIEAVEGVAGRSAWDPRILISLWIYAYTKAVSSAREISHLCHCHPAYQWLTGLQEINYHTLSDFRAEHYEALNELFIQILGVLSYEGLITLERVMHDGTKVKASAADKSFRREGTLQKHLEAARQQVEAMGDPRSEERNEGVAKARERVVREKQQRLEAALEQMQQLQAEARSKKQKSPRVSTTDPEARIMKQPDGGFASSYNVQISSDAKAGLIVGIGVSQAANDTAELPPAIERVKANFGEVPQQVVVDSGFVNQGTMVAMEVQGIDMIGPMPDHASQMAGALQRRGVAPEFFPQAFRYDAERDCYVCPAGRDLAFESQEKSEGSARYRYRAKLADCRSCPAKGQCCPQSQKRSLVRTEESPEVRRHREKMASESAREIYKQRSQIAEFPNAWIKEKCGLRQFRLRGLIKVTMEAMWVAIAYNLSQWIRLCWKPKKAMGGALN